MLSPTPRTMPQGGKDVNRALHRAASSPFCSVIFRITPLAPEGLSRLRIATMSGP
jgi:hypothetical protein